MEETKEEIQSVSTKTQNLPYTGIEIPDSSVSIPILDGLTDETNLLIKFGRLLGWIGQEFFGDPNGGFIGDLGQDLGNGRFYGPLAVSTMFSMYAAAEQKYGETLLHLFRALCFVFIILVNANFAPLLVIAPWFIPVVILLWTLSYLGDFAVKIILAGIEYRRISNEKDQVVHDVLDVLKNIRSFVKLEDKNSQELTQAIADYDKEWKLLKADLLSPKNPCITQEKFTDARKKLLEKINALNLTSELDKGIKSLQDKLNALDPIAKDNPLEKQLKDSQAHSELLDKLKKQTILKQEAEEKLNELKQIFEDSKKSLSEEQLNTLEKLQKKLKKGLSKAEIEKLGIEKKELLGLSEEQSNKFLEQKKWKKQLYDAKLEIAKVSQQLKLSSGKTLAAEKLYLNTELTKLTKLKEKFEDKIKSIGEQNEKLEKKNLSKLEIESILDFNIKTYNAKLDEQTTTIKLLSFAMPALGAVGLDGIAMFVAIFVSSTAFNPISLGLLIFATSIFSFFALRRVYNIREATVRAEEEKYVRDDETDNIINILKGYLKKDEKNSLDKKIEDYEINLRKLKDNVFGNKLKNYSENLQAFINSRKDFLTEAVALEETLTKELKKYSNEDGSKKNNLKPEEEKLRTQIESQLNHLKIKIKNLEDKNRKLEKIIEKGGTLEIEKALGFKAKVDARVDLRMSMAVGGVSLGLLSITLTTLFVWMFVPHSIPVYISIFFGALTTVAFIFFAAKVLDLLGKTVYSYGQTFLEPSDNLTTTETQTTDEVKEIPTEDQKNAETKKETAIQTSKTEDLVTKFFNYMPSTKAVLSCVFPCYYIGEKKTVNNKK